MEHLGGSTLAALASAALLLAIAGCAGERSEPEAPTTSAPPSVAPEGAPVSSAPGDALPTVPPTAFHTPTPTAAEATASAPAPPVAEDEVIHPDDALRIARSLAIPESRPELLSVKLLRYSDLLSSTEIICSHGGHPTGMPEEPEPGLDPWLYTVSIDTTSPLDSKFHGLDELTVHIRASDGAVICSGWLGDAVPSLEPTDEMPYLPPGSAAALLDMTLIDGDDESCASMEGAAGGSDATEWLASSLSSGPSDLHPDDSELVESLRALPVLPGNRWSYDELQWTRDDLWSRAMVTDTVVGIHRHRPGLMEVDIERERVPRPGASGDYSPRNRARTKDCVTWVLWRDELHREGMSPSGGSQGDVETLISLLDSGALPTVAPNPEFRDLQEPLGRPAPELRFSTLSDEPRLPALGGNNLDVESVDPPPGLDGRCFEWFIDYYGCGGLRPQFCEGVGFTGVSEWGLIRKQILRDHELVTTIDDLLP